MPRCYSYIRFSQERKSNLTDSTRRQVAKTEDYCLRHKLTLDESFRLRDLGVSAFRGKNVREGALAGFLAAVEGGKVPKGSILIIESLDRLTREQLGDALQLFLRIIQSGVNIVTLTPERMHTQETINDLGGILEPLVILSRANEESSMKSSRSTSNWVQKQKTARETRKPMGKHCPWWLELKEGSYLPIPDRVEVVRRIFRLRGQGHGYHTVCHKLNASDGPRPSFSKLWSVPTLQHYVKSRTVLGEFQPCKIVEGRKEKVGEPIPGYYPAVVTEDEYHRAQGKGEKGRTPKLGLNLFVGLLKSMIDDTSFQLQSQVESPEKGGKVYRFLKTSAYLGRVPGADPARIDYPKYERAFLRYVRELNPADFADGGGELAEQIAVLTGRLAFLDQNIKSISRDMREKGYSESLSNTLREFEQQRREVIGNLEGLKTRQSNHHVDSVGEVRTLVGMLDTVKEEDREDLRTQIRQRIRHLITSIELWYKFAGKGKPGKGNGSANRYYVLSCVHFHDGSTRWFITNEDGVLVSANEKVTDPFSWEPPRANQEPR